MESLEEQMVAGLLEDREGPCDHRDDFGSTIWGADRLCILCSRTVPWDVPSAWRMSKFVMREALGQWLRRTLRRS
jgi:hypothetical protein